MHAHTNYTASHNYQELCTSSTIGDILGCPWSQNSCFIQVITYVRTERFTRTGRITKYKHKSRNIRRKQGKKKGNIKIEIEIYYKHFTDNKIFNVFFKNWENWAPFFVEERKTSIFLFYAPLILCLVGTYARTPVTPHQNTPLSPWTTHARASDSVHEH